MEVIILKELFMICEVKKMEIEMDINVIEIFVIPNQFDFKDLFYHYHPFHFEYLKIKLIYFSS